MINESTSIDSLCRHWGACESLLDVVARGQGNQTWRLFNGIQNSGAQIAEERQFTFRQIQQTQAGSPQF